MADFEKEILRKYTPCIFKSRQDIISALAIVHTEPWALTGIEPFLLTKTEPESAQSGVSGGDAKERCGWVGLLSGLCAERFPIYLDYAAAMPEAVEQCVDHTFGLEDVVPVLDRKI